jgi:hypothetical protein
MRTLPLLSLALSSILPVTAQTAEPPGDERSAYVVPFGQTGNAVELVLAAEAERPLEAQVVLVEAPAWIAVRPERQTLAADPDEEAVAGFTFDVLTSAPAGETGVLIFEIELADGRRARHEVAVEAAAPRVFALLAPRPNPARGRVVFPVTLPVEGQLLVEAYDVLGRQVAVLHDGPVSAGGREAVLEAGRLASGVYVVRAVQSAKGERTREAVQRLTVVR